jgi:ADP-ribose pyrophosphatase YjhB (NUDIX family)
MELRCPSMTSLKFRQRLAGLIRRWPWLISLPYRVWRLVQPRFTVGVVGVVRDQEGRVLLVEHLLHPKTPWGLPGGWLERDEQPDDAVRRELREELGIEVEVSAPILAELHFRGHLDLAFSCRLITSQITLNSELLNYQWLETDEMPRLLPFHRHAIAQDQHLRQGLS